MGQVKWDSSGNSSDMGNLVNMIELEGVYKAAMNEDGGGPKVSLYSGLNLRCVL